jgi:hypothetical protein
MRGQRGGARRLLTASRRAGWAWQQLADAAPHEVLGQGAVLSYCPCTCRSNALGEPRRSCARLFGLTPTYPLFRSTGWLGAKHFFAYFPGGGGRPQSAAGLT